MKAYKTGQGAWQVSYMDGGKQKTLYLGTSYTVEDAERVASIVRDVIDTLKRGESYSVDLIAEIESLPEKLQEKLQNIGLTKGRPVMRLADLCLLFHQTKLHLKQSTLDFYRNIYKGMYDYFGEYIEVGEIDEERALLFQLSREETVSPSSVSRAVRAWRAIFEFAMDKGIVKKNPFRKLKSGREVNRERMHFVTRETIERVLSACRDDRERLAVLLGRYGGLRVPSELRGLRFGDISEKMIRISKDTKTGSRDVPLFLFSEIREVFARIKGNPDELIFGGMFGPQRTAWKMLAQAVGRAKLPRWPKLWNNLRSTRITELKRLKYDEKLLDAIFGNSEEIRKLHYEQFEKEKEYEKILRDNTAIIDLLRESGGTLNVTDTNLSLQEILALVSRLSEKKWNSPTRDESKD